MSDGDIHGSAGARLLPAWGAGAHWTGLAWAKQGLMLNFHKKQGGWRGTCIPWEAPQAQPGVM